jgi:hypothetical protein
MATHDEIGLSQPAASTTTHRLDAISLNHNSTVVLREVLVVGSPETTNALAAVLDTTPGSTAWALAVREVAHSTTVAVSSVAGAVVVRSSAADAAMRVYQSTAGDLNVTVAGYVAPSTVVSVSTGSVRVHQSTAADLNVTVAGYSTTVNVSSLAGAVQARVYDSSGIGIVASTAAPATNDNALHVRQVGYSTTANVSSVAGIVTVRPSDTNWASSAGFHLNSSGELLTVAAVTTSTTVNVSSLAGTVTVAPVGTSNSSVYFPVRITNGTAFLSLSQDYIHGSTLTASTVGGPTVMLRASSTRPPEASTSDMFVMPWATLRGAAVQTMVTDSGVSVMDSTAGALKVNVVAGSAASTTVNVSSLAGAVQARVYDSSGIGIVASTAAPASNDNALHVRQIGYSTIVTVSSLAGTVLVAPTGSSNSSVYFSVRITNGTAFMALSQDHLHGSTLTESSVGGPVSMLRASSTRPPEASTSDMFVMPWGTLRGASVQTMVTDSGVSVMDSTNAAIKVNVVAGSVAGDTTATVSFAAGYVSSAAPAANSSALLVRVVEPSTTVNVSSLAGAVIVRSSAADQLVTVYQSTASALQATARVNTSSGGAVEGSTGAPTANAIGLHVRSVLPTRANVASTITSSNSTSFYELVSSVAGLTRAVYAYAVTSTAAAPMVVEFLQSTVTTVWALDIGSGSSGVWGANLAVAPPAALFNSSVAGNINVRLGTTGVQVRFSVAYFSE